DDLEELVGAEDITLTDFIESIAIIVIAILLSRVVRRIVRWLLRRMPHVTDEIAVIVGRASGWLVVLLGIVYSLVVLGIDMVPALMVLIVVAVVTFFAGRGLMENFSTGLVLQGAPMFAPGDEIVTERGAGRVVEITGRTVVIETPHGEQLHIPNKVVIEDAVTNLTALGKRRSFLEVGVAYGTDLDDVRQALIDAAERCSIIRRQPAPEPLFVGYGDSSINFELLFWHDPGILEKLRAKDAVGRSVAIVFAERGIVISFPQRTLWWGDAGSDGSDTPSD
ncbi:MAG: mechanosensitive ion channel domain-containing protein, partial [Actinomycetota bacterium]